MISKTGRLLLVAVWLLFLAWAVFVAPPAKGGIDLMLRIVMFRAPEVNPLFVAVFNAMGIWPMLFVVDAMRDRHRPVLWPFLCASFGAGGFALLPGYALSRPVAPRSGRIGAFARHPAPTLLLFVALVALLGWGLIAGDLATYGDAFVMDGLVQTTTVDFCLTALLYLTVRRKGARA